MLHFIPSLSTGKKTCAKLLFIFFVLLLSANQLLAQSKVFTGIVSDEKNNPVSFASIRIKGTNSGVSADANGRFSIRVSKFPAVLLIDGAGFYGKEQHINSRTEFDSSADFKIVLKASDKDLKEVVVTSAYGLKRTARSVSASTSGYVGEKVPDAVAIHKLGAETTINNTNQHKTKLLTAGELSDFKKWKLWEGYSNAEFMSFSQQWDLYANTRYTVQLQNKERRAVTGQFVYLTNSVTGDTLWTAVTDNTGKAELWNNFAKSTLDENEQLEILIKDETEVFAAKKFDEGINYITLNRSCRSSSKVDIAFVVDATGSMGDEIDYLKAEVGDILANISLKDPSIDLRTGAVFYKDTRDEYVTKVQPFTTGAAQTIDFIKKQNAGGGGDYPEAVKEALEAATEKLEWSSDARTKIIFLVLDAPPHGEAKSALAVLIMNAAAKGIRIVPLACSGTDKTTEFILRSIALATNGTYIFLTDDSGIGNKHIKPTTDEFKVELLNDLLQRTIAQMCYVNSCDAAKVVEQPLSQYRAIDSVKAFPNPTQGPVTLKTGLKLTDIYIADFTGKLLRRIDVRKRKGSYQFSLANLPAATYLIRYATEDNQQGAEKVVLLR